MLGGKSLFQLTVAGYHVGKLRLECTYPWVASSVVFWKFLHHSPIKSMPLQDSLTGQYCVRTFLVEVTFIQMALACTKLAKELTSTQEFILSSVVRFEYIVVGNSL